MAYVDGFVIPVPKKNVRAYKVIAKKCAKTWMKYGALSYVENQADDVPKGKITSFPKSVKMKSSETLFFSYAVYRNKAHRNSVMAKVMNDPEMAKMWDNMPFDGMRMIFGGFKTVVSAK